MINADEAWIERAEPGWNLRFSHPGTDGTGRDVIVERRTGGSSTEIVHIMGEDQDEIYFDVARVTDVDAAEVYASMQKRLPELYEDITFEPLEGTDGSFQGEFSWADEQRSVRFYELEDATYRIIFREIGATNREILTTVRTS